MFSPNGQTTLFCLDAQGNFHRLDATIRPLGPRSDLMLLAAGDQGTVLKNVAKLGDLPVHLYASRTPGIAIVLPYLRMRTYYMASGEGKELCMVPHFSPENAVEFQNDWTPPENCKLVFVYTNANCYLLAIFISSEPSQPHTIRCLPMPNLYNDGRVCMGQWQPPAGAPLLTILDNALTFFVTSVWNTDLQGDTKRSMLREFMRFTVEGKQMAPKRPWTDFSPVIASANFNWVTQALF